MKFFKCSQCGYGYFWRSLINSISLYVRNRLIIKWYFVGERTKNYFLSGLFYLSPNIGLNI